PLQLPPAGTKADAGGGVSRRVGGRSAGAAVTDDHVARLTSFEFRVGATRNSKLETWSAQELQHHFYELVRVLPDRHVPAALEDVQLRVGDGTRGGDAVCYREDRILAAPDDECRLADIGQPGREVH